MNSQDDTALTTGTCSNISFFIIFMPLPGSGEGHIVLPLSICTYVTYIRKSITLFSTVLVSATPLKVFDVGT